MRKTITSLKKVCVLATALLFTGWASAATYTAISSGAWSSAAVWSGGSAPGTSLGLLDQVIINSGVTVTLDQDVDFDLGASLQVDGTLQSGSNTNMLTMTLANISGTGNISLSRLSFGTAGTMTFSGTANVDRMWTSAASLQLASQFTLNDSLYLDAGTLNMGTGSNFTFAAGSVLRVDNGTFTASAGTFNSGNAYIVRYVGSSKSIGLELSGNAISDVWVDLDDNSQSLSVTGNTVIHGNIHHNMGSIDLNGGSLSIMGNYSAANGAMFEGSSSSNLTFNTNSAVSSAIVFDSGSDDLNNLVINTGGSNNVNFASDLTLHGTLTLESGHMGWNSGTLTMSTGSTITRIDGQLAASGGSFDGSNSYNVNYQSSASVSSDLELTGSGLNNVSMDMDNGQDSVKVMNDLNIAGELNMSNGGMGMNGHDLTLNGSLSTTSEGWFSGDDNSDFTFNTNSLAGDTIWFNQNNNHVGDIVINADDNSDLMIGNDVMVENMTMSSGGAHIWDNTLWVASTGTITGASEDRYVMIDGHGNLAMNLQVSAPYMMYPVGTTDSYSPMSLQQTSGAAGYFMVSTENGVWSLGTSGDDYTMSQSMVNRTWHVASQNAQQFNLNLMAMWSQEMEVNSFDRDNAYLMHYTNGNWDYASQSASAAVAVGTMYSIERTGVTSLSPFAVADMDASLKIDENTELISSVYPNPVKTTLNCEIALDENTTAQVIDPTGKVVMTRQIAATGSPMLYTIDFTNYTNGVYFVNFTNGNGTASYRVVKN